jgi:general secretion pathway protein L
MAKLLGIDIRSQAVRAVSLRTGYRTLAIEGLAEIERDQVQTLEQAVQAVALPFVTHVDGVATVVGGDQSFVHRLELPLTAARQLAEVLPFELEAQVPVDIDDLVFDHLVLTRDPMGSAIRVLTASARLDTVRGRIDVVRDAIGHEPERIGCGALPLANLATIIPELGLPGPIAVCDLGDRRTDVLLMSNGRPLFARTLSVGVAGLPASAPRLAALLRQTFAAAGVKLGTSIAALYLCGAGASAPGAEAYLGGELGIPIRRMPIPQLQGLDPAQYETIPRFARALGLALGLRGRPVDPDLRRGPLNFQRGFAFVRDKAPLLGGLAATVLVSFFFSAWADLRTLDQENEALVAALGTLTKRALGTEMEAPEEAIEALENLAAADRDPMPRLDAFDVMVELSKAVPPEVVHDVDELDLQRQHVTLRGIVGTTTEAQQISDNLGKNECFKDVKISKVTQAVNSSRQKYVLELDLECPEEGTKKKKSSAEKSDKASAEKEEE